MEERPNVLSRYVASKALELFSPIGGNWHGSPTKIIFVYALSFLKRE